ncbi:MAG TPA: 3,4-dihydroxy-2-butanone-4-phosphate synthase [Nitrosopumilaceae archaeon]|nr:3,4-dihydroxy-2-butanone-4-phosphate synthase [Nitrosopumilaceae archaeon]
MSLDVAISSLQRGEFVLLHDAGKRENEVDMVVAAEFVTPAHIARMRQYAGGLVCLAINDSFAQNLGLKYMHDILSNSDDVDIESKKMIMGKAPYGDQPSFSISINHAQTFTGITDRDRALTIKEMANLSKTFNENKKYEFISSFKTPGHVPVLIAKNGLLSKRLGHTEMSVYLMELAKLSPTAAICEMLDSESYTALSVEKAKKYAKENAIPFLEGKDLLEFSKVH